MTECNAETSATDITQCDVHIPVDNTAVQGTPAAVQADPAVTGMWKLGTELSTGTPVVVHTTLPTAAVAGLAFGGALLGVLVVGVLLTVLRRRRVHALPDGGQRAAVQTADSTSPSPTEGEAN
ncbi:hypothetical protein P3F83_07810 [Mycobacteroides immunogenum]|uniref:hypothetical protein n=1 Tax=Mycobacteroides immunogenum TaxID=83262 RepID=UPI0025B74A53|nr:hypothetical protein [Mycobacteroides immunogenum]WJR35266.1 hypothetical protein P3F83_07810 [Mycobacteroides immunogenum]